MYYTCVSRDQRNPKINRYVDIDRKVAEFGQELRVDPDGMSFSMRGSQVAEHICSCKFPLLLVCSLVVIHSQSIRLI